jgi:ABC-type branched-subunit amino acid transport system substrate-binding protein
MADSIRAGIQPSRKASADCRVAEKLSKIKIDQGIEKYESTGSMKNIFVGLALGIFLLGWGSAAVFGAEAPAAIKKPVVKIGVILPLTGSMSDIGEDVRDVMLMYKDRHPEAKDIKLIFEDDQSTPKYAAAAAQKLIAFDKVDGLISFYGYGGHAVASIAEYKHVLHFGITLDRDVAKGSYSYALTPSPESHAKIMSEALAALGYKKAGLLAARSQGPLKLSAALKDALLQKGIQVFEMSVLTDERDLRPVLLKLEEQKCDAWVAINYPPQSDIFLTQYQQWREKTPLTALESFSYTTDKKLVEGRWYVVCPLPSDEFQTAFSKRFHKDLIPEALVGYDVLKIFSEAFVSANGDPVKAKEYLDNLKTAEGEGGHYTVAGRFFDSPTILAKMVKGKPKEITLEEIKSEAGKGR